LAKRGVAEWIKERIQRRVEVAYPRHCRHQMSSDPVGAHGDHRETDEVRQEADCKHRAPAKPVSRRPTRATLANWFAIMTMVFFVGDLFA